MPIEPWTTAQVLALAPDASSTKGAQTVSGATNWTDVGLRDDLLWGLCRGSGKKPYQACVDLSAPAYRCSCPSRKFPCKHTLGLLLLWSAGGVGPELTPDWVSEWHEARTTRAAKTATRRAEGGPVDPVAARKRADQRADRVTGGLAELDRWLLDQVHQGLAGAEQAGYAPYESMAARLVDAQAPGAAGMVRRLGRIAGVVPHWADRLLGELALLRLLVAGQARLGELPAELAATVRARVGVPVSADEVLAGPALRDRWQVLGQVDLAEDRLTTRRIWLQGTQTRRFALLLSFAAPGQAFPADVVPGTVLDAELCWYPGGWPLRALIARRHGPVAAAEAPTGMSVRDALANWSAALAADPWCETVAMLLAEVRPSPEHHLVDPTGDALPLRAGDDPPWWLLAGAGGHPVTVAGEYSPAGFRPLAAWPQGRYLAAPAGPDGDRRGPQLPPELLSAALVGTERRPFTSATLTAGGRMLRFGEPGAPAAALLEAAAVALTYQRAGSTPIAGQAPIEPAPQETAVPVPAPAAHRFSLLLAGNGIPGDSAMAHRMVQDWLRRTAQCGYRVPAGELPALLEFGRRRPELHATIAAVTGRRGAWLATQNPSWHYLLTEVGARSAETDPGIWATGSSTERLALLATLRATDPGAGRALLITTFDSETAEERARFIGALATGLGPADEELLERALDDRRQEVRDIAAQLLTLLPGSALRQRMTNRALGAVQLTRAASGDESLIVTPPAARDATLRRDGVRPKPPRGTGLLAWLLEETVARTPLDCWTTAYHRSAAGVLALPVADDWAPVLHRGLARATVTQRDPAWAAAFADRLLRSDAPDRQLANSPLSRELWSALPPAALARYAAELLTRNPDRGPHLLELLPGPWPDELCAAVLTLISSPNRSSQYAWRLRELCRLAATAMPPGYAERITVLATDLQERDPTLAGSVAQLAAALAFRHDMHEELR